MIQTPSRNSEGHDTANTTRNDDDDDEDDDDNETYSSQHASHARSDQHPSGADDMRAWLSSSQQTGNWPDEGSTREIAESRTSSDGLEGHIANTDLLNPSDALDLLAQVADLDPDRQRNALAGQAGSNSRLAVDGMPQLVGRSAASYYPPLDDGIITPSEASYLVKR